MDKNRREALLAEYSEVSNNFRLLTDIRFRLLAFLPAASAAAIAFQDEKSKIAGPALSLFGLMITLGLLIYNTRNDQLYDELIGRAAKIERLLGLYDGAFAHRPRPWFALHLFGAKIPIDHGTGVSTIYSATAALWLYEFFEPLVEKVQHAYFTSVHDAWAPAAGGFLTLACAGFARNLIKDQYKSGRDSMRDLACRAMKELESSEHKTAIGKPAFIENCAGLAGAGKDEKGLGKIEGRAKFYGDLDGQALDHYMPKEPAEQKNSHFIALITDMPARWILDVYKGRR